MNDNTNERWFDVMVNGRVVNVVWALNADEAKLSAGFLSCRSDVTAAPRIY